MGQSTGLTLSWEETKQKTDHIRDLAVAQFITLWNREKDRSGDPPLWGDEIEYLLVSFDAGDKNAKLLRMQKHLLAELNASTDPNKPVFVPEMNDYMMESTPRSPYGVSLSQLLEVEPDMRHRRDLLYGLLGDGRAPITISSFPHLGATATFTEPHDEVKSTVLNHSLFFSDDLLPSLSRYRVLVQNINQRRRTKPSINVPIFIDDKTPHPFFDPTIPQALYTDIGGALVDHIYMDSPIFGGSCCCLQVTMQLQNVDEARKVYDALMPLTPLMMTMTASSPAWRGYLSDVDCRWNVLADALDDRTEDEGGTESQQNQTRIRRTRYGLGNVYLSTEQANNPSYNDVPLNYNDDIYKKLVAEGVDDLLAKHIATVLDRDALASYADASDAEDAANHFENIYTSVWQTLRFKPPPDESIGWRVEFRSMESCMTDFESAAYSVFLILLTRAILHFDLNLYIPMSKVEENMKIVQRRDAARSAKMYFRKDLGFSAAAVGGTAQEGSTPGDTNVPEEFEAMSCDDIFNGNKDGSFVGLIPLVGKYVDFLQPEDGIRTKIHHYLNFIRKRSNGTLLTTAQWIRRFVRTHPGYKFDSVMSQEINYDLIKAIHAIASSKPGGPELQEYMSATQ